MCSIKLFKISKVFESFHWGQFQACSKKFHNFKISFGNILLGSHALSSKPGTRSIKSRKNHNSNHFSPNSFFSPKKSV